MNVQKSYSKWLTDSDFTKEEQEFASFNGGIDACHYYGGFQDGKKSAKKRIKELEKVLGDILDYAERERLIGDNGSWEWDDDDDYTKAMKILQKGKKDE